MKKICVLIVVLFSLVSVTFAADTDWDCSIIFSKNDILSKWDENNENEIVANLAQAMPRKALEKAFDNLNAYCCATKKTKNCNITNDNKFYPESIFLFDHILDVYLRRLDAKQQNDNWDDLLYDLEPDLSGKDWRDFITNRANDINGSLPLEINEKYKNMWTYTQNISQFSSNYWTDMDNWKISVENAIKLNDSRTLRDKYNLACDVAKYIGELNTGWIRIQTSEANKITTQEYVLCKNLTNNRIQNENIYTKTVLMQKANVLLWSNMKSYLGNYFVSNKLSDLQKLVFDINTSLYEVNKAIITLTPRCS